MQYDIFKDIDVWSPEIIALLIATGFLIGIINTLAGSGTALGYALFMSLGLPPAWANGTVRIGVIPQTFAATLKFHKHKLLDIKSAIPLALAITAGSIVGAQIAVSINPEIFRKIIGAAMIIILFFLIFKPEKFLKGKVYEKREKIKFWHLLLYFLIGLYGGFIHVGVGIFLLIAFVSLSGYDLVRANSLKVFTVLIYTPFALAVFMINGEIHYAMGLLAAIGNTIGGIVASRFAVKFGAEPLRWFLIIVIVVFTAYLFGTNQ